MPIQRDNRIAGPPAPDLFDSAFLLGDCVVEPATRDIQRDGRVERLEPRVMRLLECLVAHRGRVVSRHELESNVWSGMIVTDDAVTNAVIKLRKALGDRAREPRYVETIAKTGYRLIAPVEPLGVDAEGIAAVLPASHAPRADRAHQVATATPGATPAPIAAAEASGFTTSARGWPRRHPTLMPMLATLVFVLAAWVEWRAWTTPARPTPATAATVVAVLPFDNLSGDPTQDYFADGITQDLITDLSKLSGLQVVSRHSVLAYRGSNRPASAIGRALGAGFVVGGSVQRAGDRLRINVNLVDVNASRNRWGERYDRELADIFALQDDIAAHVVTALQVELAPGEQQRMLKRYAAGIEAYDELLRGLDLLGRRTSTDNAAARAHFEHAIALEPRFARGYAGLALTHALHAIYGHGPEVRQSLQRAESVARQGLAIDDTLPQLHYAIGLVETYRGDLGAAIAAVSRAIELRPSYADGYGLMAWILHFAGRPTEGMAAMRRAIALNPHVTALYRTVEAALHYELGQLDQARRLLEDAVAKNPGQLLSRLYLAAVYAATDQLDAASWQVEEIRALDADFRLDLAYGFPIRDPGYRSRFVGDLARAGLHSQQALRPGMPYR
jgi:TolB-like protein/DNA-binding winged helix-turn-helix (wHTH) protein